MKCNYWRTRPVIPRSCLLFALDSIPACSFDRIWLYIVWYCWTMMGRLVHHKGPADHVGLESPAPRHRTPAAGWENPCLTGHVWSCIKYNREHMTRHMSPFIYMWLIIMLIKWELIKPHKWILHTFQTKHVQYLVSTFCQFTLYA